MSGCDGCKPPVTRLKSEFFFSLHVWRLISGFMTKSVLRHHVLLLKRIYFKIRAQGFLIIGSLLKTVLEV